MKQTSVRDRANEGWHGAPVPLERYYSVELSVEGLEYAHQFKLWSLAQESMCVIVKEDSQILGCLRVGDVLTMRYYTTDAHFPIKDLDTEIRHIGKEEQGRFKGHYRIDLAILYDRPDSRMH
jgi:hypothetical protein